jgi:predicted dehydrogenase
MGTGTTNDLLIEIFGDQGALRFNSAEPSWLEVYDVRDPGQPLGGMRGFRKLETVQHHEGQKSPDWSMPPGFVRTHAECQYQFLKAVSENLPPSPTLADGLRVQEAMEAAIRSSEEGRWVAVEEVRQ